MELNTLSPGHSSQPGNVPFLSSWPSVHPSAAQCWIPFHHLRKPQSSFIVRGKECSVVWKGKVQVQELKEHLPFLGYVYAYSTNCHPLGLLGMSEESNQRRFDLLKITLFITLISVYGDGNGNPFQYSCLECSMDRRTWWATVHEVTELNTIEWLIHKCIWLLTIMEWILANNQYGKSYKNHLFFEKNIYAWNRALLGQNY